MRKSTYEDEEGNRWVYKVATGNLPEIPEIETFPKFSPFSNFFYCEQKMQKFPGRNKSLTRV
jgi:hypothetical protein